MTTKCTGLMGRIFGHRFRPVITLSGSTYDTSGVQCKSHVALEMADKYRSEEFHGCICQRCGTAISNGDDYPQAQRAEAGPGEIKGCWFDNETKPYGVIISASDCAMTGQKP